MNNTQEQSNLLLRLPSYYSLLSEESIYLKACLSSPDASVFSPTACISAEHGAMESHRSSLTLWSTDHALFWFPFDLTVWVHRFPPPEAHLACWHEPRIGISRLSFSADGWQSCPNAAEVVIFSFQIVVSDLWPSFFFFSFSLWKLRPARLWCVNRILVCHSVSSPDTHTAGSGRKKCFKLIVGLFSQGWIFTLFNQNVPEIWIFWPCYKGYASYIVLLRTGMCALCSHS